MPYRCQTCQKLSAIDDAPYCKQRDKCFFERVVVIHYASSEGTGREHGTVTSYSASEQGAEPISTQVVARLHCGSTDPNAMVTPALHAVTCLKCLETIETLEQKDNED